MTEQIDLGPCLAIRHETARPRCAVVLPGREYPTSAPVLWFAREAVMAEGWGALETLGLPAMQPDPLGWERDCAERALAAAGSQKVLVVGKSLASLLAGLVSDRGLPAVWLTPVLTDTSVAQALSRAERPTLLIGGTADPLWVAEAIPANPALEVIELPGVDHGLQVRGDPGASLDALRQMTEGFRAWLRAHLP